jgi:cysteine synthase
MPGYRFNLTTANIEIHKTATAQEIIKDFPDGLDYMITEWEPVVISLVVPKS